MSKSDELVLVGRISATHGIRGQLKVHSFSGDIRTFSALDALMLKEPGKDAGEWFKVVKAALHGNKVLLTLAEFGNINEVLHLVGREVFVRRDQLPELEEDEYFWCDLLGMTVRTTEGEILGSIADIIETGSNDVYVVRSHDREYLIPAIEDVVVVVDVEAAQMTISPIEGLLDL